MNLFFHDNQALIKRWHDNINNSNDFDYVDFCTENEFKNNANYKVKL